MIASLAAAGCAVLTFSLHVLLGATVLRWHSKKYYPLECTMTCSACIILDLTLMLGHQLMPRLMLLLLIGM